MPAANPEESSGELKETGRADEWIVVWMDFHLDNS
jgi:hypothetical protein